MKISVITVAYKSPEILQKSIDSFFEFNDLGHEAEYILVDNSPKEDRVDKKLSKDTLAKITYIPADNRGFGAGNNEGVSVAKGEILAFINPDIIFIEPIMGKIYQRFQDNKSYGMMGCKLLYEDLTPGFSFYYDYQSSIIKKWSIKVFNKVDKFNSDTMYISGANMFVRKDLFLLAGMFDEELFMYYEEPDLTRRIKNLGNWEVHFNSDLKMIHLERKSTPNSLNSTKFEFESAIYYGKKYHLNYKRKILFEYRYLLLKKYVYKLLKRNKYKNLVTICKYLKDEIFDSKK